MPPVIAADRLYGISFRPQELAMYGGAVSFALRYAPMAEEGDPPATSHCKVLVLEITARLDPADELARQGQRELSVAKCGWEIDLTTADPCRSIDLPELAEEVPLLLERIADTLNELARRAGLPPPMGIEVVTHLLHRYRTREVGVARS